MNKVICDVCQKNEASDSHRLWVNERDLETLPEPEKSRLRNMCIDLKTVASVNERPVLRDICRPCLYMWLLAAVNKMTKDYAERQERGVEQ